MCTECREPTEVECFRCKTPLCNAHLPDPTARCGACEVEYRSWPSREPRVLGIGLVTAALWFAVTVALLDRHPAMAGVWALVFPIAVGLLAWRWLENGRAIFLRQEKRERVAADQRRITF